MSQNNDQLDNVVKALEMVSDNTKQMIFEMCTQMSELEIIQSFNQHVFDFFSSMAAITRRMGVDSKYKVGGYKALFDNAVKINVKLPVDKFTLVILEFAPDIYEENEDSFMQMTIPDTDIKVGNEFNMIRSEMFKALWKIMSKADKAIAKEKIILMTTYAHAYFYKTLLRNKN